MAAHVLIFPFPLQGHINSMLKLAELLSLAGLHVTFLNTDHNHRLIVRHSAAYTRLASCPRLRFRSIPDGFDDDGHRSVSRLLDLAESLRTRAAVFYKDLLLELVSGDAGGQGWPALTCVIADGILPFAVDVAIGLGVPALFFRTSSACSVWSYFCIPKLFQIGDLPFPDDADLDEPIRSLPDMEGFLRRRDLPVYCRNAKDSAEPSLQALCSATANTPRARAFILNTFEALEPSALFHIRSYCPNTYAIGPLHALLAKLHCEENTARGGTPSGSLWEEDRSCIAWLDAQPERSVVYISFGSLAVMSPEDFCEFRHGLLNSGQRFLWVVRRDLVSETREEEEEAAYGRGIMVEWAPQEEVLGHPAVGCFLTHSGWNSTLESVVAGVPMLCWPSFADQHINSRFVGEVWRVGMDMKDVHDRGTVEKIVREAMVGEKAEELRRSAAEMAATARKSVDAGGSSFLELEKLIQEIKSMRRAT